MNLERWERGVFAVALIVFLSALGLYASDFPLSRYLFGVESDANRTVVGAVSSASGVLRRQSQGSSTFNPAVSEDVLYSEDTLVTGLDSNAVLQLSDGSSIELAPATMVRLRSEGSSALGGIARSTVVDVVAGAVKGEAKSSKTRIALPTKPAVLPRPAPRVVVAPIPPPPAKVVLPSPTPVVTPSFSPSPLPSFSPSPIPSPSAKPLSAKRIELISPASKAQLKVASRDRLEKDVPLSWRVTPVGAPVTVVVRRAGREIFRSPSQTGKSSVEIKLREPGSYEWEVISEGTGKPVRARSGFTLRPEAGLIELLEPWIDGAPLDTSRLTDKLHKNFDITLRWKAVEGVGNYHVTVKSKAEDSTPVLEKTLAGTEYLFNQGKVFTGQIFYQVSAALGGGWTLVSEVRRFSFNFVAPKPVVPANHSVFPIQKLAQSEGNLLLTWEKTHFTESYEIEISRDPEFKKPLEKVKVKVTENFYLLKAPSAGKYYWRVRSSAQGAVSPPSAAFDLEVTP